MSVAAFCVRRPILTMMVSLIVIVFGITALMRIPIDLLPEITYPTITVRTNYGNASPEEMERLITERIEQAVAAVPGVEEITSESTEGNSSVRVQFSWGTNVDVASNDMRDRIDRILDDLPQDIERPELRKFDVAAFPIVILGISSNMEPIALRQLVDDQVSYRIQQIPGVASADIFGGLEREIQVNLDIERVKALSIPLDRILSTIRTANVNLPAGNIERGNLNVTIRTPGEFVSLQELGNTVVDVRDGAPIYLRQVATISDTHAELTRVVRINGEPGIRFGVRKQSGTNTVEVADRVLAEVERLNRDFPQLQIVPVIDQSLYIRQSIDNVRNTVLTGGVLAICVLLLFLRSSRSTFVISTSIPISIVASFALIYFCGYTLNLMTLGGLALGVGMMVDNSIVVLENIYRLRNEEKLSPRDAAIKGTDEVTAAITASTLTTLVIFMPLFFVEGVSGLLFRQLAVVVSFSLLCSLAAAITLVPMFASRILRPHDSGHGARNPVVRALERCFDTIETVYADFLEICLRLRWLVTLLVVAIFAGTLLLIPRIGTEFLPSSDQGEVRIDAQMAVGTRLEIMDETMRRIEAIAIPAIPEMTRYVMNAGASGFGGGSASSGNIQVAVGPTTTRTRSSADIANDVRRLLRDIPGAEIRVRAGEGLRLLRLGASSEDQIQVEIYGYEFAVLDALAQRVKRDLENVAGITDVRTSRESGVPQEVVRIDRDRAADLGLSVSDIARALETAISGTRAGNFREMGDEYPILVKLADSKRLSLEQILDLRITNGAGTPIVLRNVVSIEPQLGPQIVERKGQERLTTVYANYSDRTLDEVIADVQATLRDIPRPDRYQVLLAGDYEEQREAFRDLMISLIVSIILVYMVLASLYESFVDPLIVMFSVPLAAIGVLVMLFLTNTTLNTQSFIGCIMLGGIVVNNAILLVDQATELRVKHHHTTRAAVLEAGRRRFRPILMTSLTTMLGLLPLALGIGEGSDQQAPLARAVIGGMLSSTLITLVFIPIVYRVVHGGNRPGTSAAGTSTEPPVEGAPAG